MIIHKQSFHSVFIFMLDCEQSLSSTPVVTQTNAGFNAVFTTSYLCPLYFPKKPSHVVSVIVYCDFVFLISSPAVQTVVTGISVSFFPIVNAIITVVHLSSTFSHHGREALIPAFITPCHFIKYKQMILVNI